MDWGETVEVLATIVAAFVLALPVGWERERSARSLGMRTFPLVAMASASYLLLAEELFATNLEAQSRVLAGLMTGIGFIGAGAILKVRTEREVRGTATAAGVWATGALGAACAYGRFDVAVAISAVTFATFRWMTPLKEAVEKRDEEPGER